MKPKLVIIYLVDGARPDVLRSLLESGELPSIRRHILEPGTWRTASSVLPSTTGPAYLPFLTGYFPGTVNIPGIRWLDRHEYRRGRSWKYRFRSYNGIEAPWFNDDLPKTSPTLFELFDRPFSIHSLITRGIPRSHNLTTFSKPLSYIYAHLTDHWSVVDRLAHARLMSCLDRNPDFVFAVFPAVDSYSHLHHPEHEKTIAAYKYVDRSVGEVAAKLQRLSRYDETLLLMTSDHGLTATRGHLDLALFLQDRGIPTMCYPIIWKRNPHASVMISGNALGHVYLLKQPAYAAAGNGRGGPGSTDRPDPDLASGRARDTQPALGAMSTPDGRTALDGRPASTDQVVARLGEHWQELLERDEVDFVISYRSERSYDVTSTRGRALVTREGSPHHGDGARYTYEPQDGDPLGLGLLSRRLTRQESLEVTFDSEYPDALVQIDQMMSCNRCGDFVVIARNGSDLRRAFEWPEHHSSHGSLQREHMMVPLLYNQKGWNPGPARTADVFSTVLKWAGKPVPAGTDGTALF